MEDQLRALFYDPATGLASASALFKRAKEAGLKVTLKQVKEFVKAQEVAQTFVRRKVKAHYPLVANHPFVRIQMDLADVSNLSRWNKGIKFIFLAIDVYTRYVLSAIPLRSKGNAEVFSAFQQMVEQVQERIGFAPAQVDSDQEASFMSLNMKAYCKKHLITQKFLPVADYKGTAVVDRLIRSVRELMNRYMVAYNTKTYLDALPQLIDNINSRVNQGIRTAPNKAIVDPDFQNKREELIRKQIERATATAVKGDYQGFEIGDKVRVLLRKTAFEKGTLQKWSSTTHTVESFSNGLYHVSGRVNGYKPYELLRVGAVQYLPVADPVAVAVVADEARAEQVDRRVSRRVAKEGIKRNDAPPPTDEEKSERAIRGRKPVNRPFMIGQ